MAKTDSLFPILNDKTISPLAHRAAEAQLDSAGCLTEYRPLESRSILSKVNSKRGAPFSHGINPYRGCEFACRYCYARYTHEFLEMRDPQEFERKIYFKENAAWLLEQELRRLKPGTQIAMGTATDPYQPLERKQKITRSLLEVFAKFSGFTLGIVTKSTLIARDVDLLQAIAERNKLTVHHTVTTLNVRLARILEPRAPRPDLRIATLAKVRAAGVRAGVLCSPLMPGITESRSRRRRKFLRGWFTVSKTMLTANLLCLRARALSRTVAGLREAVCKERVHLGRIPETHGRPGGVGLPGIQARQAVF